MAELPGRLHSTNTGIVGSYGDGMLLGKVLLKRTVFAHPEPVAFPVWVSKMGPLAFTAYAVHVLVPFVPTCRVRPLTADFAKLSVQYVSGQITLTAVLASSSYPYVTAVAFSVFALHAAPCIVKFLPEISRVAEAGRPESDHTRIVARANSHAVNVKGEEMHTPFPPLPPVPSPLALLRWCPAVPWRPLWPGQIVTRSLSREWRTRPAGARPARGELPRQVSLRIKEALHVFHLPLPAKPQWLSFDPGNWIVKKLQLKLPKDMLLAQLEHDSDLIGRIYAAQALGELASLEAVQALRQALEHDTFWGVQAEIATVLGKIHTPEALEALLANVHIPHPKARRAVVTALGEFKDERTAQVAVPCRRATPPCVPWANSAVRKTRRPTSLSTPSPPCSMKTTFVLA